jgi:putative membrane protein
MSDKKVYSIIISLSLLIFIFLCWLIYLKPVSTANFEYVSILPTINAILNTLTSVFLITGILFIKKNRLDWHKRMMLSATFTSALFLFCYIAYHHFHGDSKFNGIGSIRYVYFFILISHILLSAIQVPLILSTLYLAFTKKFDKHKKVAKVTFPIWLYVSITGVLIYLFLNIY